MEGLKSIGRLRFVLLNYDSHFFLGTEILTKALD